VRPRAVLALCLVALLPAAVAAQTTLSGRVTDQVGNPMSGVTVEATANQGTPSQTATDANGTYHFDALSPGRYAVTFSALNFGDVRRPDIDVGRGAPVQVDVTMRVSLNASVVVTASDTFRNLADLSHPEEDLVGVAAAASEGAVTAQQIESRPIMRAGEVLESVPGVIISQHSGEGKANQYYLRGFNLDHGTDFATTVAGLPVNLPSNAHGQGYSDLNFLIPELVTGVQFKKGPYDADSGDFSAAGSANIDYASVLDHPLLSTSVGEDGWARTLAAASPRVGPGTLLAALEVSHNDGPWTRPDAYDKVNGVLRYSVGDSRNALSITGLAYSSSWNSTDQVPDRAIAEGLISRFGSIDPTDAGATSRYSVVGDWEHSSDASVTRVTAFASAYRLNLFSDFTYFLDDPVHGDQFEQSDQRWTTGGTVRQTRTLRLGSHRGEYTIGTDVRNDDIPLLGLYHTEARVRLSTVSQDSVIETSVGAFAEAEVRWTPWFRTTGGLRADGYRFDVSADVPANSGIRHGELISPKGGAVVGPWKGTEFYLNAGSGFHSNDARGTTLTRDPSTGDAVDPVTPLVRAIGAEVGVRSIAIPHVQTTLSVWRLDLASELVFAGDAGTTEPSRPSERYGVEWSNYLRLSSTVVVDGDLAWSHARFTNADPVGQDIPGSAGVVASVGVARESAHDWFGSIRLRYFGPRPLIEDDSVRSPATRLFNAEIGDHLRPHVALVLDAFNLLNTPASDVDYYYVSRLPGEPLAGVADIHTHPTIPRTLRIDLRIKF
jgi:hypothetical protein